MRQRRTVDVDPAHRPAAADDAADHDARPTTTIAQYYEIQTGDSLSTIAEKFGVDLAQLVALNKIKDPNKIQAGQKLRLPPTTVLLNGSTTVAPATTAHP